MSGWQATFKLALNAFTLDVDLSVDTSPVALIGPNGAGKTTLLRTLAGAYRPEVGRIVVGERVLFDAAEGVDLPPEARRVGYVPQGYGLFPHLTTLENVAFGAPQDEDRRARDTRARAALEALGCGALADRRPRALSGGEQQKVALARALVTAPELLLLDEPLAALDAAARRTLRKVLAEHLGQTPAPAIVITHDVRDVRALQADVVVLEAGKVVQQGSVETLRADPATAFVAEFFDVDLG